jgi:pimeloyl-ACP methyl ester carboxylesterase
MTYTKMMDDYRGHPPKGDVADWGARFSGNTIASSLTSMDVRAPRLDMPIPFFIVQGRDDHITGAEPARAYAEDVRAPQKTFVAIDGRHCACFTDPDAFVGALRKYVRPLAI